MKKWILIFIAAWAILGVFLFFRDKPVQEEAPGKSNIESQQVDKDNGNTGNAKPLDTSKPFKGLYWNVKNPGKGNYTPSYEMVNLPTANNVNSDHNHVVVENTGTLPNQDLMTFFAEAQIGTMHNITAYVNPELVSKDITTLDMKEIVNIVTKYANTITRNRIIEEVYIYEPQLLGNERANLDVRVVYSGGKTAEIKGLPMVKPTGYKNWFIDLKLSEVAALVEKRTGN